MAGRPVRTDRLTGKLLLGQVLGFVGDPFHAPIDQVTRYHRRGAVLIDDGDVRDIGEADKLRAAHPTVPVTDHGEKLISAGFVDAHMHYPQTGIIASWGKRLIDWLNTYTFPEEMRFGDADYAAEIAALTCDLALRNGTTALTSYCSIHPESVDAIFTATARRDMTVVAGKTCMDRNAPEGLRDTAQSAYDQSKALIGKWHGKGRASYAITPRFSPTSTPEQLEALGGLWAEHPDCLMQTHLSEQRDEVDWVRNLFPDARDYLETYERFGLVGNRALFGHAIWLEDREKAQLLEAGASLVHCPTSNSFIGSGLFDLRGLKMSGQSVGLATDTGGGSSFSMFRTMAAAYEIAQLRGDSIHPAELLWLATEGSAQSLHMGGQIGHLGVGAAADLVVIDLHSTPEIAQRAGRANDIFEALFPTIMMGDDRAISAVYLKGERWSGPQP